MTLIDFILIIIVSIELIVNTISMIVFTIREISGKNNATPSANRDGRLSMRGN